METSQSGRWTPYTWEQRAAIDRKFNLPAGLMTGDRVKNIVACDFPVGRVAAAYLTKQEESAWARETWPLLCEWRALVCTHGVGNVPADDNIRIRTAEAEILLRILDAR